MMIRAQSGSEHARAADNVTPSDMLRRSLNRKLRWKVDALPDQIHPAESLISTGAVPRDRFMPVSPQAMAPERVLDARIKRGTNVIRIEAAVTVIRRDETDALAVDPKGAVTVSERPDSTKGRVITRIGPHELLRTARLKTS